MRSVSSGLGQRLLKLRFKSVIDIILLSYSYIQKLGLSLDCDSIEFSIARGLWHLLHGLLQLVLSERPCDGFSYSVFRWDSFGVVKSTLGGLTSKVLLDGVTYFRSFCEQVLTEIKKKLFQLSMLC